MAFSIRQKLLKFVYPFLMKFARKKGKEKVLQNEKGLKPSVSFYSLSADLNSHMKIDFSQFRGKKVLIANTASNCGFTAQYEELQQLYKAESGDLVVIGFPANDFKEQETGSDDAILKFCQVNFGVSFPIARKSKVVPASDQNPVFRWLSSSELNGWNDKAPEWNFSKYLVNEEGVLTHYFPPMVSPVDEEVIRAIRQ